MSEEIVLIGGGGHCISCIDVIESQNKYKIAGIIDLKEKIGEKLSDYSIIGSDDDLIELVKVYKNYLITIGQIKSSESRIRVYNILKSLGACLPLIISPYAYVSKNAKIGDGTIVMHQALVNANAQIGNNCIINTKALIEHDSFIDNHCHISTGAIINGGVRVYQGSFIGSGAVTKEYINIGQFSFIKANSIVKSDYDNCDNKNPLD